MKAQAIMNGVTILNHQALLHQICIVLFNTAKRTNKMYSINRFLS